MTPQTLHYCIEVLYEGVGGGQRNFLNDKLEDEMYVNYLCVFMECAVK
jgi:hypothetical protein